MCVEVATGMIAHSLALLSDAGHMLTDAAAIGFWLIAVTASSIVLMPLLGWAKLRLGRRLDSGATVGEGIQNLLYAAQALAALVAVIAAGAGVAFIDPVAALLIAGIAAKEGLELWRGEECDCHAIPGLAPAPRRRLPGRVLQRMVSNEYAPAALRRVGLAGEDHRANRPV